MKKEQVMLSRTIQSFRTRQCMLCIGEREFLAPEAGLHRLRLLYKGLLWGQLVTALQDENFGFTFPAPGLVGVVKNNPLKFLNEKYLIREFCMSNK